MNKLAVALTGSVLAQCVLMASPLLGAIQLSDSPIAGSGVLNFQIAPDSSRAVYRIQRNAGVGVTQELFSAPVGAAGMQVQLSSSLVPDDEGVVSGSVLFTPDGSALVYGGDLDTDGQFEVYSSSTSLAGTQVKLNSAPAHTNIVTTQTRLLNDGTRVLYRADLDTDNDFDLYIADAGTAGTQIRLTNPPVTDGDVAVNDFFPTPNGMHAIFLGDMDTDGVDELYSASTSAAGTQMKLNSVSPFGGDVMDDFQITPDSNRVIYRGQLETILVNELYSAPADGTGPQIKLSGTPTPGFSGVDGLFRLTPDGSRVMYTGRLDTNARELFSAPTNSAGMQIKLNTTPVAGGGVIAHQFTPDGNHAIFRGDMIVLGQSDLFSAPSDMAGQQLQLNTNTAGGNVGAFQPTADGNHVIYIGDMNTLGQPELYRAPTNAAGMQITLSDTTIGGGVGSFFLSPDGTHVGYLGTLTTPGVFDLFVSSTTSQGTQMAVTNLSANQSIFGAEFTPDGEFIIYSVDTDGDFSADTLIAANVAGGSPPVQLSDPLVAGGRITQFLVSSDSQTVIYRANQDDLGVFNLFAAGLGASAGLPGDYNNNGVVDAADYTVFRDNEGTTNVLPNDAIGGTIGQAHYQQWVANFGATLGSAASDAAAVPEPATLALTILGGLALLARWPNARIGGS